MMMHPSRLSRNFLLTVTLLCLQFVQLFAADFRDGEALYFAGKYSEAKNILAPLADSGNMSAKGLMGRMFLFGWGVEKDCKKAVRLVKDAAIQGDRYAQRTLGSIYGEGCGVPEDEAESWKWQELGFKQFLTLAEHNDVVAQYLVGLSYRSGIGVPLDEKKAFEWYAKAANQKFPVAQHMLAAMYEKGVGVKKNQAEAVRYYKLASDSGYAPSQVMLGQIYMEGRGVSKNLAQALYYLDLAATQGDANGQMLAGGVCTLLKKYDKAIQYYELANEKGEAAAQYALGAIYLSDEMGGKKDLSKAFALMSKSAKRGYAAAQKNLAHMYYTANGVKRSYRKAYSWWIKAVKQNDGEAMHNIGVMYVNGTGVEKNTIEGLKWMILAANNGSKDSSAVVKQLKGGMNRDSIKQAEESAASFDIQTAPDSLPLMQNLGKRGLQSVVLFLVLAAGYFECRGKIFKSLSKILIHDASRKFSGHATFFKLASVIFCFVILGILGYSKESSTWYAISLAVMLLLSLLLLRCYWGLFFSFLIPFGIAIQGGAPTVYWTLWWVLLAVYLLLYGFREYIRSSQEFAWMVSSDSFSRYVGLMALAGIGVEVLWGSFSGVSLWEKSISLFSLFAKDAPLNLFPVLTVAIVADEEQKRAIKFAADKQAEAERVNQAIMLDAEKARKRKQEELNAKERVVQRKAEIEKFWTETNAANSWGELRAKDLGKWPEIAARLAAKIEDALFTGRKYRELLNFINEANIDTEDKKHQEYIYKSYVAIGLDSQAQEVYARHQKGIATKQVYEWGKFAEEYDRRELALHLYEEIISRGGIFEDVDVRYRRLKVGGIALSKVDAQATSLNNPLSTQHTSEFLSKYEISSEIGRGGMGIIYAATDKRLGRTVAIKKLKEEIRINRSDKERFLREARTVASMKHPNIVDIYDILEDGADVYLVFEYLAGQALNTLMAERGSPYSWEEAKPIIKQVCSALEHAHSKRIIHRDLKPANIMLLKDGSVKVMDFGIAREAKNTVLRHSGLHDSSGTLMYMAPEQHLGDGDERSDIYSLGVTIYEMLTGRVPFIGADLYEAKKRESFRPVSELVAAVPEEVNLIISKCLSYELVKRYSSAKELVRAL